MTRAIKITIAIVIAAVSIAFLFYYKNYSTSPILPTYFSYSSEDIKPLRSLKSNLTITQASLNKWDAIMFDLVKKNKLGDTQASKIYAYVYTAQREGAFLSKNIKHEFMGSIGPLTAEVLCLFFTDNCDAIRVTIRHGKDSYSNSLKDIVLMKIKNQMQEDKKQNYLYQEKKPSNQYWAGVPPYYGQDVGSWKTWLIASGHEFIAPPPPPYDSVEWKDQLTVVTSALKNTTPEQVTSIVFWAGNPSTITPPGIWLVYANDYMTSHRVDLSKRLFIRSILSMGLADSIITVFNAKYTYWSKRPFMRDPMIHTVMPTPNHPSYPAGHSSISSTAATILSFYFPENKKEWGHLASLASQGRVWGGIHFPIDTQQGLILGKKVGEKILINAQPLPEMVQ